jgi:hypothetical protein
LDLRSALEAKGAGGGGRKRTFIVALFLLLAFAGSLAYVQSRPKPWLTAETPTIMFFMASPQEISRGETVTLDWQTRQVPTLALEWGPAGKPRENMQKREGLPPTGTMTFQPQEDTIYVLECETTPAQMCTESASVRVR